MLSRTRFLTAIVFAAAFLTKAPSSFCYADDATAPDSRLDIIQYRAPAGWAAADKGPGSKIYTAPDSTAARQAVILVLLSPAQPNLNFRGMFDAVAKQMTASGKIVDPTSVVTAKSRQGYDAISQNLITEIAGGERVYTRLVAVNVQNRMATLCYVASGGALYMQHTPDMDNFLQSVSFDVSGKNPVQPNMAAAPAAPAANPGPAPANPEDTMLAKARDDYSAGKVARRKPHTVLGSVLTLDGRPIPNLISCNVSIYGTTIAAERTTYNTEPEKNGLYELQVPDGLYRVTVNCVVSVQGRNVPVDIMPLDGRATRTDESSAPGIVQDFRLVLAALRPGQDPNKLESYFGGVIAVSDPTYTPTRGSMVNRHPGSKLRLSFKPEGLLIDGSRVEPFSIDLDLTHVAGSERIQRVGIGVYHVTGLLVAPDGSTSAVSLSRDMIAGYGNTVDIYWDSVTNYTSQRTEARLYVRD